MILPLREGIASPFESHGDISSKRLSKLYGAASAALSHQHSCNSGVARKTCTGRFILQSTQQAKNQSWFSQISFAQCCVRHRVSQTPENNRKTFYRVRVPFFTALAILQLVINLTTASGISLDIRPHLVIAATCGHLPILALEIRAPESYRNSRRFIGNEPPAVQTG